MSVYFLYYQLKKAPQSRNVLVKLTPEISEYIHTSEKVVTNCKFKIEYLLDIARVCVDSSNVVM